MKINIDTVDSILNNMDLDDAHELLREIDKYYLDKTFSAKHLLWLFESLTNDFPKEELLKYLETGNESALKSW